MDAAAHDCSPPAALSEDRTAGTVSVGLTHGAAVVSSDTEVLAVALPFLDAGLRAGDLVALTCRPDTVSVICEALGERSRAVLSEPGISLLGARAPDAVSLSRRLLERVSTSGSGRLRVLSGIDFGSTPADWREGQRYESVTNRLLAPDPIVALCMYDRRRLSEDVVASAAVTHPEVVHGPDWSPSPRFQDPARYVPRLPLPREPVEDGEPVLAVDDAPTLAGLRHQIGAVIAARVPDADQRDDLYLGASEIAANAFRHGVRPVSARVWADGAHLIVVIADRGTSYADPFSGFAPAHGTDLSRGGMGLWLARKLFDHVDLLPGPDGLTVRLSARLR